MSAVGTLVLVVQLTAAQQIDEAIAQGITSGVYPGAVVVTGTSDQILFARGYGHFSWSAESAVPDPDSTLFDLASLTKVVATTPAVMRLVEERELELDRPVDAYLPEFVGEGKERVTVRHLLEHRSGLRAFLPLNEQAKDREEARHLVLTEPLRWAPGSRVVYSDLNFMLLGWIVERISGTGLDVFAARHVFEPAGLNDTRFRPPVDVRGRIAPVGVWRGHVIAGQLHDQNAVRLGGVSGHAGLYSTGRDLARYAQVFLGKGRARTGTRVFRPETVTMFTERTAEHRALGWEIRDTTSEENTGALLSAVAYGHGGYTGTSIWIDPAHDLFVVVLTNRVFAPRTRRSISRLKAIRGRVADAAMRLRRESCNRAAVLSGDATSC